MQYFIHIVRLSVFLAFATSNLNGQGEVSTFAPTSTPTPNQARKTFCYLRFLNLRAEKTEVLQLVNPTSPTKEKMLEIGPPLNYYAEYIKLSSGIYNLQVCRVGDTATPVKVLQPILLKPGSSTSLIIKDNGAALGVELIDDGYDLEKTETGTVTVRDFWQGADVTVSSTGKPPVTVTLQEGASAKMENLPRGIVPLYITAHMADGSVKRWNTEADFTKDKRRATLFIISDRYKRFQPVIAQDGRPLVADDIQPEAAQ